MKFHLSQLLGAIVTYEGKTQETIGVETFRFSGKSSVQWESGQYYVYILPGALLDKRSAARPFTVSSAPGEGHLQFTTRVPEKPSLFKQQLLALKPGAKVYVAGPFGFFTLAAGPSVFIAGGIGVTPFRAMLVELAASGSMPDITLLYSNRDQNIAFKDEFDALAKTYPQFKIHYLGEAERLSPAVVQKYVPETNAPTFYISGPKPLVENLASSLHTELGVESAHIKHDSFKGYPWPLA
jgi:ferredoxin-NADP reductase